jgi:hypothetical protein
MFHNCRLKIAYLRVGLRKSHNFCWPTITNTRKVFWACWKVNAVFKRKNHAARDISLAIWPFPLSVSRATSWRAPPHFFVSFSFSRVENHRPIGIIQSLFFFFEERERLNGRFQWKIWLLRLVRAVPSPFHVNRVISRLLFPTAFSNASKLFVGLSVVYFLTTSLSLRSPYSLFMSVNTFSRKFSNDNSIYQQLYTLVRYGASS